jgi:hypothetical protein
MLFMLVSRAKPGIKREELVERFTGPLRPETWDLVRSGELSQVFYKVGDEPGFFAILKASSFEEAKAVIERSASLLEAFDLDVYPVSPSPQFG